MTDEATVDAVEQIRSSLIGGILGACDMDLLGTVLEEVDDLIQAAEERGRDEVEANLEALLVCARCGRGEGERDVVCHTCLSAEEQQWGNEAHRQSFEAQLTEARKQRDLLREALEEARTWARNALHHPVNPHTVSAQWLFTLAHNALDATREGATDAS